MAARTPLAAHNNPFNKSILKKNALFFADEADVCNLINANEYANKKHIESNYSAIENEFTWDAIIDAYENYFLECHPAVYQYYPLNRENTLYKKTV
ncbi:MAG: hypothetical protein ABJB86_08510 [Bacteroidota bacterium]